MSKKNNKISIIKKGWGYEKIWVSNEHYCSKYLNFEKKGSKFSMHFHKGKHESWIVIAGSFKLSLINTKNAKIKNKILKKNDIWVNEPFLPHQLEALEDNSIILEVSTKDTKEDNFRVLPGNSQLDK